MLFCPIYVLEVMMMLACSHLMWNSLGDRARMFFFLAFLSLSTQMNGVIFEIIRAQIKCLVFWWELTLNEAMKTMTRMARQARMACIHAGNHLAAILCLYFRQCLGFLSLCPSLGSSTKSLNCSALCLHVHFYGTWIFWLGLRSNLCRCMLGSLALAQGLKKITFVSYSASDLMFGVLICLDVDFCGTWILWLWLWSNLCAACWVLWSWLHVGFFGSGSR